MTTVGDAIIAAMDSSGTGNWSAVTGGTEPAYYNTEDYQSAASITDDFIMVLGSTFTERITRLNDANEAVVQSIELTVSTKNDANKEERLDTLVAEVKRIMKLGVTGYHQVYVARQRRQIEQWTYKAFLTVSLVILSTDSAITPGSTTTSDWTVDTLTVNTSISGNPTAALGATTVTGNITVTGTVDGEDIAANQTLVETLLMYGSANAAWVPCVFELESVAGKVNLDSRSISNVDGTDLNQRWGITVPLVKGSLGLNITGIRIARN